MNDNSRIAKNTLFLYLRMIMVMGISLYTSRIILKNLGVEDYGIYNVVGSVVTMFVFLNSAMTSVTQRYLSFEIGRNNDHTLNKVFNICLTIHFGIALLVIICSETIGLWFLNNKLVIPENRLYAANWVYQCSIFSTVLMIISVPYNALIISREKMGTFAFISILDTLFKLLVAFVLSVITIDKLIIYAILVMVIQLIDRMIYGFYCNKNFKESHFRLFKYEPLYKEILIFSCWGLLGHISTIITQSVQNILLNVFFNPIINAARGIAVQVTNIIMGFSNSFQLSVEPQITKSYSQQNIQRTHNLILNSSRYSMYLLYLMLLPIFLRISDILSIWLVEVPDYTVSFLKVSLIISGTYCLANPLNIAIRATGKIKMPELIGGGLLVMNLPISYLCLKKGMPAISVFYIQLLIALIVQIYRVYYANKSFNLDVRTYILKVILKPMIVMTVAAIIPNLVNNLYTNTGFIAIVFISLLSIISTIATVYMLGLDKEEKQFINNKILTYIKK